ncbi:5-methylcytosine-specific restriction enzyme McrBC, subunit McrC [Gimesia maris DSM 8797]|nr:5-methylcytosine-specific restriction enzyme McrBC, subunit McrC [Gimesia maris DSM 8797]
MKPAEIRLTLFPECANEGKDENWVAEEPGVVKEFRERLINWHQ